MTDQPDTIESADAWIRHNMMGGDIDLAIESMEQRDSDIRADERARVTERLRQLVSIVLHYTGPHVEDEGVCSWCSLDESLPDEYADWPCWVHRALATERVETP